VLQHRLSTPAVKELQDSLEAKCRSPSAAGGGAGGAEGDAKRTVIGGVEMLNSQHGTALKVARLRTPTAHPFLTHHPVFSAHRSLLTVHHPLLTAHRSVLTGQ
jgi:hypothetical protein